MMNKIIAILACLLFFGLSLPVSAEEDQTDEARGDKYASVRSQIQTCFACHGEAGASTQAVYPIIAGQHLYYIYLQLKDFKSGLRENAIMQPIVAGMEKEEMKLIAEYFSEQTWPDIGHKSESKNIAAGKKVVDAGQCVQCHLGGFEGNSGFPRLAGQFPEYQEKTMLDFKNKVRKNNAAKGSLFATFSDEDIRAVADYLGGFKEE